MKQVIKSSLLQVIVVFLSLNTLLITPFWNKDGMIIPKMIIVFLISMYLFPFVMANRHQLLMSGISKITIITLCALLIQNLVVMFSSSAPLEQQIFGRTGRGLGFITTFTLSIIMIATMLLIEKNTQKYVLLGLVISGFISSLYSVLQSFGFDFLRWETRTNGVIGTLGNPNFQSAFAAVVLVPSVLYFMYHRKKYFFAFCMFLFFSFTIYRTQSTQGMIAGFFSVVLAVMVFYWYRNKHLFLAILLSGIISATFAILGMLNIGPMSGYLYKVSVQSRGDFWRSAFATANDNPFFGVGLDSFGDYSLKYRDEVAANHAFAEYTDNAHNYFLEYAATGGYPSAILNLFIVFLVGYAFLTIQKRIKEFDVSLTSLFSAWAAFQMTTVISPGNLVTMHWNAMISGAILGLANSLSQKSGIMPNVVKDKLKYAPSFGIVLAVSSIIITFPLFNVDRMQLTGMQTGDANLVMKATTSYPESTVRYSLIGRELLNSGLTQQSLDLARKGVDFNPNSPGLWALILVNPIAGIEERLEAKSKILKLDPLNKDVQNFNP
jgi:O-antigen ligase